MIPAEFRSPLPNILFAEVLPQYPVAKFPLAGFYSKDKIIETAFNAGGIKGILLGSATLLGAAITAFYM